MGGRLLAPREHKAVRRASCEARQRVTKRIVRTPCCCHRAGDGPRHGGWRGEGLMPMPPETACIVTIQVQVPIIIQDNSIRGPRKSALNTFAKTHTGRFAAVKVRRIHTPTKTLAHGSVGSGSRSRPRAASMAAVDAAAPARPERRVGAPALSAVAAMRWYSLSRAARRPTSVSPRIFKFFVVVDTCPPALINTASYHCAPRDAQRQADAVCSYSRAAHRAQAIPAFLSAVPTGDSGKICRAS